MFVLREREIESEQRRGRVRERGERESQADFALSAQSSM